MAIYVIFKSTKILKYLLILKELNEINPIIMVNCKVFNSSPLQSFNLIDKNHKVIEQDILSLLSELPEEIAEMMISY